MKITDENTILVKVLSHYGSDAQIDICIEEMSELTKALIKNRRYHTVQTQKDIVEELTDVLICTEYIKQIFGISQNDIDEVRQYKIDRINRRISNEQASK